MDEIVEEQIVASGLTWRVGIAGPEDGAPVLLLHGFPEYWATWRLQMTALADAGYRVYAPDLPGYGGTDAPHSYLAADIAGSIADLRIQLAQEGMHVIGHDWGGMIGHVLASEHPEAVLSFVAASAPHPDACRSFFLKDPAQLLRSWYVLAFQVPMIEQLLGNKERLERAATHCVTEIDDAAAMGRALAYYRANLRPWDLGRFKAGRITQPGLVVHGSRDPAIGDYLMRATAEQFEDLRGFHALDCGHFIQRLRTEELNDVLLGFLGSVA